MTGSSRCTTRDFCSDSVGAWLNYPVDYDFGYTWFHEAEWEAGNRRSVCWAKTEPMSVAASPVAARRAAGPGLLAACSGSDDAEPQADPERPRSAQSADPDATEAAAAPEGRRLLPARVRRGARADHPTQRPCAASGSTPRARSHVGTLDAVVDGHLLAVDSPRGAGAGGRPSARAAWATSSAARSRSAG